MKDEKNNNQGVNKTNIYTVPFELSQNKKQSIITTDSQSKLSREQIINQAFKFHSQGNILEAAKYYQYFINQGFRDHRVFF